ncbi:hypothetical protein N6H18_16905 [Reichenbachiella agarivorans]|uniref:Uncharacterized protein n=1 Tax=Reichenbachiella agarivorans TaxID=2979464 RepID=A0ABY6CQE9_9BACT|nr:hypothetical protein [Reichenbachiella agarivorans]UXP32024.1 hypothetical protein N6H18_16905 [Reichenbachiella agarivorans]
MENLNELGLIEMRQDEMTKTQGGYFAKIWDDVCGMVWWNSETGACYTSIGNEC